MHLQVNPDASDLPGLTEHADVLVSRTPLPMTAACRRVRELLVRYPGCLVAAVPALDAGRAAVGVQGCDGGLWQVRAKREKACAAVSMHVVASVTHAWLAAGQRPDDLRFIAPTPF
ncbi:hypothetical protein ACFWZT_02065 [Streptomyces alboflavus]|uniref:hypothetical protein n=1 Tax=Streptomyces alboflavus TaxID=67267 RepID=UPI0036C7C96D